MKLHDHTIHTTNARVPVDTELSRLVAATDTLAPSELMQRSPTVLISAALLVRIMSPML